MDTGTYELNFEDDGESSNIKTPASVVSFVLPDYLHNSFHSSFGMCRRDTTPLSERIAKSNYSTYRRHISIRLSYL